VIAIEIKNFQSIASLKFDIDGFTALVGRSNIGKSAIVRAIKNALTNPRGTDFVRHGKDCSRLAKGTKKCKCFASVRIKSEKMDLLWEKGDGVNRYKLNGKDYDKVEVGTPEFLIPDFEPVKVGTDKQLLQVSDQFAGTGGTGPIFLLNQSGSVVADVISDVAKLDSINVAIRLAEKDRKEANSTRKIREKDAADLKLKLVSYDGLDGTTEEARDVASRLKGLQATAQEVETLKGYVTSIRTLAITVKGIGTALKAVLPEADLGQMGAELTTLTGFAQEVGARAAVVQQLEGVDKVEIRGLEGIKEQLSEYERVSGWLDSLRSFKSRMGNWKPVAQATVPDIQPVTQAHAECEAVEAFTSQFREVVAAEASLAEQLLAAEAEEQAIVREFEALGVCPTCSQAIHTHTHG